jgi:nucleotide-binding universal stress UspA family protein
MIETVLIATDGSEAAAVGERFGVALAAGLGARIAGVSVVEDRCTGGLRASSLPVTPPPLDAVDAFLGARAEAAGRRLAERAREKNVACACDTVRGIADDLLVERSKQADLVVIGRDGEHAAFRTALIGSTVDGRARASRRGWRWSWRAASARRSTSSSIRRTRAARPRASTRCAGSSARRACRCGRPRRRWAGPTRRSSTRRARRRPG